MPDKTYELQGIHVVEFAPEGQPPRNGRDATDMISAAWNEHAAVAVIPVARLDEDFFRLKTGIAGEILQKFVTYRLRVAVIGDIARYVLESSALRDFVYECNQGDQVWFLPDLESLKERLGAGSQANAT